MVYFEHKGCVQQNLCLNCVSHYKKVFNRRRHWPECIGHVNRTFCFTGTSCRAQLLKGRLVLFLSSKTFLRIIPLLFLRASNHQLVDKMNYIEFTVLKAFTSEFKLRNNPVKAFSGMCVRLTSITFPVI